MTPITVNQAGSLVHVAFHVLPGPTVPNTFVQLVDTVTPNGQWFGTSVTDSQGAMILSPWVDQLVLPTGSGIVSTVTLNRPSNIETTDQTNHQLLINALSENDSEATQGTTPLHVNSEGREEPQPIIAHTSFGFPTNAAPQSFGQVFQIGNLPLLNTLLYRNSPGELTADRLFLALANGVDAPTSLGLVNLSLSSLMWDAALGLDWLAGPGQFPEVGKLTNPFTETPDQKTTDQQAILQFATEDTAFTALAKDMDDFGDLGDY